jgi:O-antigen/teichoic acid export membrane protein
VERIIVLLSLKNKESSSNIVAKVNRVTVAIVIIISLIIYFVSQYVLPIMYGRDFVVSVDIIKILLLGACGLSIQKILTKCFSGIGKPIITSWSAVVGLIINIPLLFLLIPSYGIKGAALATSISYVIMGLYSILLFIKESEVKNVFDILFIKISDINNIYKNVKKIS